MVGVAFAVCILAIAQGTQDCFEDKQARARGPSQAKGALGGEWGGGRPGTPQVPYVVQNSSSLSVLPPPRRPDVRAFQ